MGWDHAKCMYSHALHKMILGGPASSQAVTGTADPPMACCMYAMVRMYAPTLRE
eukprot:COSAG06_NODE_40649_length_400_cov_0.554817_1_plen_53_part_10